MSLQNGSTADFFVGALCIGLRDATEFRPCTVMKEVFTSIANPDTGCRLWPPAEDWQEQPHLHRPSILGIPEVHAMQARAIDGSLRRDVEVAISIQPCAV